MPGLPEAAFGHEGIEYHGRINCLKGGLVAADRITTVSPSYAREITTAEFGAGLEGLLQARAADLRGILNGIDAAFWDPTHDPALPHAYSPRRLGGKAICKAAALPISGRAIPAVWIACDEDRAHRIIAGGDLIAVPSRFEPCGLTQLYGLRYGTLPVVRATGGLADTVSEADGANGGQARGNGFVFRDAHPAALSAALSRALAAYRQPANWKRLQRRAMAERHDWDSVAIQYEAVYAEALAEPRAPRWRQ